MMSENKKLIIGSVVVALVIILSALFYSKENNKNSKPSKVSENSFTENFKNNNLGELDSAHRHMSLLIFINGEGVNLSQNRYMLQSEYVHLENGDGTIIHTHATGVTLPYFLSTLNIKLTQNCIKIEQDKQFCSFSEGDGLLKIIVNGKQINNIKEYELRHKDKILIVYGNDNNAEIRFKINSLPEVPAKML